MVDNDKNEFEQDTAIAIDLTQLEQSDYHTLDASGLLCPEPVMMLHKLIRNIAVGDVIKVLATDSSTQRDIPRFCEFLRHPLLAVEQSNQQYIYWIKKRLN